jgi:putative sigma-54 modulation protein
VQVSISTRHGNLSLPSQEKIRAKAEKLGKFYDRVTAINVTIDLEHEESPEVEIRVLAEHIKEVVATHRGDSLMASIDNVIHRLEQQLKRHKEKLQDHRGPGRRAAASSEEESSELG